MSTSEPENNAYEPTVTSEPASGTQGVGELAGAGIRIGVGIIDSILVGVGGFVFGLVAGGALLGLLLGGAATSGGATGDEAAGAVVLGGFLGSILGAIVGPLFMQLIFMLIEAVFGISPAGKMLGIKVAQADGSPGSFGNYFIRALVKFSPVWLLILGIMVESGALTTIAGLLNLVLGLGLLMALGESKQTLYDKLTGTAVILTK